MVLDDIADLFDELSTQYRHKDIARHFGRERKFVINVKNGCNITLNAEFVAGLNNYGYELKLVKKERGHNN